MFCQGPGSDVVATYASVYFPEYVVGVLIRFGPSKVYRNQLNLYPKSPTAVAKLLQYSGSRVEHRDGFSS